MSHLRRLLARTPVAFLLFATYPNRGHHAPGLPELRPMREEPLPLARGAALDDTDVLRADARIQQLPTVRLDQIEVNLRRGIPMSRRSLVQKQQRIPHVERVAVKHLMKQFSRVRKLRLELRDH